MHEFKTSKECPCLARNQKLNLLHSKEREFKVRNEIGAKEGRKSQFLARNQKLGL